MKIEDFFERLLKMLTPPNDTYLTDIYGLIDELPKGFAGDFILEKANDLNKEGYGFRGIQQELLNLKEFIIQMSKVIELKEKYNIYKLALRFDYVPILDDISEDILKEYGIDDFGKIEPYQNHSISDMESIIFKSIENL